MVIEILRIRSFLVGSSCEEGFKTLFQHSSLRCLEGRAGCFLCFFLLSAGVLIVLKALEQLDEKMGVHPD